MGISHNWDRAIGSSEETRKRVSEALESIRSGEFARYLVKQESRGYPDLRRWQDGHSDRLRDAERRLRRWLQGPTGPRYA